MKFVYVGLGRVSRRDESGGLVGIEGSAAHAVRSADGDVLGAVVKLGEGDMWRAVAAVCAHVPAVSSYEVLCSGDTGPQCTGFRRIGEAAVWLMGARDARQAWFADAAWSARGAASCECERPVKL